MNYSIIVFSMEQRSQTATQVQEVLTKAGCIIKTRLGLHNGVGNQCSESGLVILELVGESADKQQLFASLNAIDGITAKLVEI